MDKSLSMLVVFAVLLNILSVHCHDYLNYDRIEAGFKKINYHLFDNVQSEDSATNVAEASRWLEEEVRKTNDKDLVYCLEFFTALPKLLDENMRCTKKAALTVEENFRGGGNALKQKVPTRVAEVITDYAMKHAEYCNKHMPEETYAKLEKMNPELKEKIKSIMNKLFGAISEPYVDSLWTQSKVNAFYEALKIASAGDQDAQYLGKVPSKREGRAMFHPDKFTGLVVRNLVEPCQMFIEGLDLVDKIDSIRQTFFLVDDSSEERRQFERLIDEYRTCQAIIKKHNYYRNLVKTLMEVGKEK